MTTCLDYCVIQLCLRYTACGQQAMLQSAVFVKYECSDTVGGYVVDGMLMDTYCTDNSGHNARIFCIPPYGSLKFMVLW